LVDTFEPIYQTKNYKMKTRIILMILAVTFIYSSCKKDDEMKIETLSLDIMNLSAVESDEQYEGWIIVDGTPVSTGTFTVDGSGNLSQSDFAVNSTDLMKATDFVLSIEPMPDSDPAPSAIKILGGAFSSNMASVSVAHGAALGDNFTSASGTYILATPTTTVTTDELSGVWYLDLTGGSPAVGLSLPSLPSGWVYEGWAVINGTPVTSGTFTAVDMADNSAPFSGSDGSGPAFPGEDFVANAPAGQTFPTDLSGATFVISIEPNPDNSESPFAFKPLIGTAPAMATDHNNYMLDNMASTLPSGTVTRK